MLRSKNPAPDLATTNSFASWGAGAACYAFSEQNQRVVGSCYTNYNVALRFFLYISTGYRSLLQNRVPHAHICARVRTRAHACAPVRDAMCYIATMRINILRYIDKNVVRPCSAGVVCASYNKILPFYCMAGTDGAAAERKTAARGVRRVPEAGLRGSVAHAGAIAPVVDGISEKWRISAVFQNAVGAMFDGLMFDGLKKWRVSAVFQLGDTTLKRKCSGAVAAGFRRSPEGPPPTPARPVRYIRKMFFFGFQTVFSVLPVFSGSVRQPRAVRVQGILVYRSNHEQNQRKY